MRTLSHGARSCPRLSPSMVLRERVNLMTAIWAVQCPTSGPRQARRLTGEEGHRLRWLVRRGEGKGKASVVRYWRAPVVLASAGATRSR
jgi:hypothetical protein